MRRWRELTTAEIGHAAASGAIVVVPVGAIEQHGPHLPVSTDADLAEYIVEAAAAQAALDVACVVAPTVVYGYSHDHLGIPGTLSVSARVVEETLVHIGASVLASGFSRLAFVNGHGSNDRLLYYVVRRIRERSPEPLALAATTYWKLAASELASLRKSAAGGMGHACELETSLMLHFAPQTVSIEDRVSEVPPAYSRYRGDDLLAPGPIVAPDRFVDRTPHGVSGDALAASAESGRAFAQAITSALAAFLEEFAVWPLVPGGPAVPGCPE